MRIIGFKEFHAMPAGTVFFKYEPMVFTEFSIKGNSIGSCEPNHTPDFFAVPLNGAFDYESSSELWEALESAPETGQSIPMDFETVTRDGSFAHDQLFAVFERKDVEALIARLQATL